MNFKNNIFNFLSNQNFIKIRRYWQLTKECSQKFELYSENNPQCFFLEFRNNR